MSFVFITMFESWDTPTYFIDPNQTGGMVPLLRVHLKVSFPVQGNITNNVTHTNAPSVTTTRNAALKTVRAF